MKWELIGLWLREHYDHLTFTGSVPRTFVGPLSLAGVSWPFLRFGPGYGGDIRGQLVGELDIGQIMFGKPCNNVSDWGKHWG